MAAAKRRVIEFVDAGATGVTRLAGAFCTICGVGTGAVLDAAMEGAGVAGEVKVLQCKVTKVEVVCSKVDENVGGADIVREKKGPGVER